MAPRMLLDNGTRDRSIIFVSMPQDTSFLQAALIGYQAQREKIISAIAELEKRIGGSGTAAVPAGVPPVRKKRKMSAAARKRIAAAQKRRWAEFHKNHAS